MKFKSKRKIAFFVRKGLDSFINDIINNLSLEYTTKKIIVTEYNQIIDGIEWADICWFEWCDNLIIYGSKLAQADKKKIICRIHGYEVYTNYIKKVNWSNVDQIIIVSPHIKRIFQENTKGLDLSNLSIDTIFCGVNTTAYPLYIKTKGFNLGYLGYINFKKNLPLTFDIFKKIYDIDNRYRLHLAGAFQDPRTLEYLKYFIKEYNLTTAVQFNGWLNHEQKLNWFKKIDYMIISSIDEGLCYAAAEGMCSGIKPILHNCEGIKNHYAKKYIFNNIDEAIKMILSEEYDSQEYRRFIVANYSLEKELLTLKKVLKKLENEISVKNNTENIKINTLDLTYADRYKTRNKKKTSLILNSIEKLHDVIDIGCNKGYIVQEMLKQKYVKRAYGIDLNKKVVDKDLLNNPNFTFFKEDIEQFIFTKAYDIVIYSSLHHHIFGKYGKNKALKLFNRIIDHCNNTLIFETGIIAEQGDYYWKDEINKYFSNDELHIQKLIQMIGPRLKKSFIIGSLDIHGVKRPIWKFLLQPIESMYNLKEKEEQFYKGKLLDDNNFIVLEKYKRTVGSDQQKLVSITDNSIDISNKLYDETIFYKLKDSQTGEYFFAKKNILDIYKQMREFYILNKIFHSRIIKLYGVSKKYGLLFPYLNWQNLATVDFHKIDNKNSFIKELNDFYAYAYDQEISMGLLDFAVGSTKTRRLIDLIDLHPNNILLKIEDGFIKDWKVIDLEYYSNNNYGRNMFHKEKIFHFINSKN